MQARVTVAVPSLNQGRFLDDALASLYGQDVPIEVFVMDGGSTDETLEVVEKWRPRLAGFRSGPDGGQAAAINAGIASGSAPYVAWLNSDDWLLDGALKTLLESADRNPDAAVVYGRAWNVDESSGRRYPVWVEPFTERRMALRCVISQPATLVRRTAWEAVGGVDETMRMAMDYDLWWRLYRRFGAPLFVDAFVAVNRVHAGTKTETQRRRHYQEAMGVVRKYYGRLPLKWWWAQPFAVWYRSFNTKQDKRA